MSYDNIDPILNRWAGRHGRSVLTEARAIPRRVFHTSSPAAETFQMVVEPERDGRVRLDAHLIETDGDAEIHYIWEVAVDELEEALDVCAGTIDVWFNRKRR